MPSRRCSAPNRPPPATSLSRSSDEEAAVTLHFDLDDPADELLTGGDLPRWQRVGGLLAAVGLLVTLVVLKVAGPSSHPDGRPTPGPQPTATDGPPTPPPVFPGARILDVVVNGPDEWVLTGSALMLRRGGEPVRRSSLAWLQLPTTSVPLLALDPSHNVIWLVLANAVPTRMIEYDSRTLRALITVTWPQLVYGAAAVNGYLYLANDLGVAEVSADTMRPRFVPGLQGALGPIAADPVRKQLIAVDASDPLAVYRYRHGRPAFESTLRLPMGKASLAVADGQIWVGGYGYRGAMLYRLDPRSLRPVSGGRVPEFDPGAVLLAAGQHVVWVHTGDASSDLFACVDATTGVIEQRFHLAGAEQVASTAGAGVVATGQGVLPLTMGDCAG